MSASHHAEIIMNRLNQLQNMQTTIIGSIGAVSVGVLATANGEGATGFLNQVPIRNVLLLLSSVILISSHLFSMYQIAAIFKCGLVLKELEEKIDSRTSIRYFSGGNMDVRNSLHFISHSMPTFILLSFPFCLYFLGILTSTTPRKFVKKYVGKMVLN